MAHPKMFDNDDPYLGRVRELAEAFPGTAEKISHGRPAFYTTKVFAYYRGSLKLEGEWIRHPHSLVLLADRSERLALLEAEIVYLPAYLAPSGWVGIDLGVATDWAEVEELLDTSYRLTAPKRQVAQLDTRA